VSFVDPRYRADAAAAVEPEVQIALAQEADSRGLQIEHLEHGVYELLRALALACFHKGYEYAHDRETIRQPVRPQLHEPRNVDGDPGLADRLEPITEPPPPPSSQSAVMPAVRPRRGRP
jgi:hypothetical protein